MFCSSTLLSPWLCLYLCELNQTDADNIWSINKKHEEINFCKHYHINWESLFFFFSPQLCGYKIKFWQTCTQCISLSETGETAKEDMRSALTTTSWQFLKLVWFLSESANLRKLCHCFRSISPIYAKCRQSRVFWNLTDFL